MWEPSRIHTSSLGDRGGITVASPIPVPAEQGLKKALTGCWGGLWWPLLSYPLSRYETASSDVRPHQSRCQDETLEILGIQSSPVPPLPFPHLCSVPPAGLHPPEAHLLVGPQVQTGRGAFCVLK